MKGRVGKQQYGSPEDFVHRLVRHLRHQVVWDSLLTFSPPILAILYLLAVLYWESWIPALPLILLVSAVITFGLLTIIFRFRPRLPSRSEEHTSELQSQSNLVCRLLLEKK